MRRHPTSIAPLRTDASGLATIEFALALTVLVTALLNGLEVARWSYQKMEVANAVHSAAHAAWNACEIDELPARTNCPGFTAAVTNGLSSTSLGTSVQLATNFPAEAYYCVNSSGALQKIAEHTEVKPTNCTAVSDTTRVPGDYVTIRATYTYTPMFGRGLTVGTILPSTLTYTSFIRLQ